jgi:mono/diheme cytochrome c family protein
MRLGLAVLLLAAASVHAAAPQFESAVAPILQANCVGCHGAKVKMKDLDLSGIAGVLRGSESGPVITPGKPDQSRLYQMVRSGKMPMGKPHLSDADIAAIEAWIAAGAPSASHATRAEEVAFDDVQPVLLVRCAICHGLRRQEGGLDLHDYAAIRKGGKSGPAIVPGQPHESLLLKRVEAGEMPPKKGLLDAGVKPVTPAEAEKIAKWIAAGAPDRLVPPQVAGVGPDPLVTDKDRQFWAFQPPKAAPVPQVQHADRVRNPIDAFLLRKLEAKGLSFSPEADRLTLIRRVSFDLTGLPPEPAEVQAFLADRDPQAYEKLVDRLLASPCYGERWGRMWLDLAGYADSEGGKLSADTMRPEAWRYRDYVIRSFSADKPYDRFLLEQIAGDELADYEHVPVMTSEIMDNLIATGFLRMAPDSTNEREVNFAVDRLDVIADEIDVLSSSVMGLTIKCARCHSHKYDPIPQRDYYRLEAVFKGAYDEHDWIPPLTAVKYDRTFPGRYLPYVTPGATPFQLLEEQRRRETRNSEIRNRVKVLQDALKEQAAEIGKKLEDERLATFPADLRERLRRMLASPASKRDAAQKELAAKYEKDLKVDARTLKHTDPAYRREAEETERQVKLLEAGRIPEPKIRALWDRGDPSPTYILRRGSATSFGPLVGPGVPAALTDGKTPFVARQPWPGAKSTGRRLAFARWLVRPDNPLTARVMVNRIWKEHFGTGIVKSLANFGRMGTPPTHPELLDWLAREFVTRHWSIKAMQRLMLTSSAYRQSSTVTGQLEKLDPENALCSRMPLQRMDAEQLNDTVLLVAGRLDESRYGPPAPVLVRDDGLVTAIGTAKGWRRSIYVQQRRTNIPTMLDNFDLPQMNPNCVERSVSTVAMQALQLLNNATVHELAGALAERVAREAGSDAGRQVDRLYWITLSRPPSDEERKLALDALAHVSLAKLCHTLLNSAACLYID